MKKNTLNKIIYEKRCATLIRGILLFTYALLMLLLLASFEAGVICLPRAGIALEDVITGYHRKLFFFGSDWVGHLAGVDISVLGKVSIMSSIESSVIPGKGGNVDPKPVGDKG